MKQEEFNRLLRNAISENVSIRVMITNLWTYKMRGILDDELDKRGLSKGGVERFFKKELKERGMDDIEKFCNPLQWTYDKGYKDGFNLAIKEKKKK